MCAAAGNKASHPVEIECPTCRQRLRVPLHALSAGARFACQDCRYGILISPPLLRQLLREIEKDLRTPDDLPIILRPGRSAVINPDKEDDLENPDASDAAGDKIR